MKSENQPTTPELNFTETECELLGAMRARYQLDHDLFTGRELSHLRFMRWLQETHPATEDSSVRRNSPLLLAAGGSPAGLDSGGTPWCVL